MDRINRFEVAALIGVCALATALYLPFLSHPFQYDDEHTIVANPGLSRPDAWSAALAGTIRSSGEVSGGHYRPLTYLTYWITLRAAGPSPVAFHAVNLALHLAAIYLLLLLVRALTGDRHTALLAAGLFAIHPATSEAVLYASARATLLSSLGLLVALACYVKARQSQFSGQPSAGWWTGWAVAGVAAVLAKETGVVLPLLCLAADALLIRTRDAPIPWRGWNRWWPHLAGFSVLAAFVVWLGLPRVAMSAFSAPDHVTEYLGVIAGQIGAIALAISLFVIPWPLTVDHPLPAWPGPWAAASAVFVGAWCVASIFALASRNTRLSRAGFFALWVVIVALPTTFWPLNVPFQEHRAYLQHAGLAALAALAVGAWLDARTARRTGVAIAGAAWLVTSGWLIVDQGRRWNDSIRLWDHARAVAPSSFRSHANAGLALASAGRWDEAESALATSLALNPDYPPALVARGVTAHRRGNRIAAAADYERAALLRPDYVPALYNRGLAALEMNNPADAEAWYRRALAINPLHADALLNLGVILLALERTAEADSVLAAARAAAPDSAEAQYYSGISAQRLGRLQDAQRYFDQALRLAQASGRGTLAADAQARLNSITASTGPSRP